MLPVSISDLAVVLAQASRSMGDVFHPPTDASNLIQILLRWFHFIAGIVWIGHLYFFNLVNVNLMKALDGPTKGKVIPQLMPRALWWFRWGAVITVLAGLMYYAMYILAPDVNNARSIGNLDANTWVILLVWFLIVVAAFVVVFFLIKSINNGWMLAVAISLVSCLMGIAVVWWLGSSLTGTESFASNKTFSIGIGGGLGLVMLLNVWGIIWPNQKRIISWTYDNAEKGTAIPAESAKLARVAFLASRVNTWLSLPMLFLMGASAHYVMFGN